MVSPVNSTNHPQKKMNTNPSPTLPEKQEEETLPTSFYEASTALIETSQVSVMNINIKILTQVSANQMLQYGKRYDPVRCISGMQWWFNIHKSN